MVKIIPIIIFIIYNYILTSMRHTLHKKRKISKKIKMKRGRKSRQKYSRYRRLQKGGLRSDTNSGEVLGITHTWQFTPFLI